MLILAKSILGMMIGFFLAVVLGWFLIPVLKKLKCKQSISVFTAFSHAKKNGTPTIGGLIFIIPTLLAMLFLYLRGSLQITHSLLIILFVFISYAMLGFVDDYLKIREHNNDGLSIPQKLLAQVLIALIFFYIYMQGGGDANVTISSLNISVDMKWFYGIFILFLLVGSSNAVNLTDGLDGLAGGIATIFFVTISIIINYTGIYNGLDASLSLIMVGATLGFLVHNFHPAKIFLGNSGSMFLGYMIAVISLLGFKNVTITSVIVPLLILAVPILDTFFAIVRRIIKGQSPTQGDKKHIHHQLLQMTSSQVKTVLIIYLVDILFSCASIIYVIKNAKLGQIIYAILVVIVLWFVLTTDIVFDRKTIKDDIIHKVNKKNKEEKEIIEKSGEK